MPAAAAARHRRQASCEAVHNANLLCEPGARRGRAGRAGARQVDMGPRAGSTTIAAMDSFRQGLSGLRDTPEGGQCTWCMPGVVCVLNVNPVRPGEPMYSLNTITGMLRPLGGKGTGGSGAPEPVSVLGVAAGAGAPAPSRVARHGSHSARILHTAFMHALLIVAHARCVLYSPHCTFVLTLLIVACGPCVWHRRGSRRYRRA